MMRRILCATRLMLQVQVRSRFPHLYGLVTALTVLALRYAVPEDIRVWALPLFLFVEPGMLGVQMVGAHRYLEREQHALAALLVSPLRPGEYLSALVLTVALQATGFGVLAFGLVTGSWLDALVLAPVLLAFSLLSCVLGFVLSLRYRDFIELLLASIPWVALWQLPVLAAFEIVPWAAVLPFPSGPALYAMMELSAGTLSPFAWLASCVVLSAATGVLGWLASRHFVARLGQLGELG